MSPRRRYPSTESDLQFRELLASVLEGKDRDQIARELSKRIGRVISLATLNDYTARTHTAARFPAAYVPHLCAVLNDDRLQLWLLSDRHRAVLALGERRRDARGAVEKALKEIARLYGEGAAE
jgi:hypothetical protein